MQFKRDSTMTPSGFCPSPLKISKESHFIKKSSSSSSSPPSSFSSTAAKPQQQRHPVIIYTHSPKIIHTHPRDFMALVQKLTGLSRSPADDDNEITNPQTKQDPKQSTSNEDQKNLKNINNDDNDSSSVLTDEKNHCSSNLGDVVQVNSSSSCFVPPMMFDPSHNHLPCFSSIPIFAPNNADFLCSAQPFYNYSDSLFFMPNMRSSVNCSTLENMKEFREF